MENKTSFRELTAKLRNEYGDGHRIRLVENMLDMPETLSYEQKFDFQIYRVPERIRKVKEEAFEPLTVSIGPFYYGHSNLAAMEEHKLSYMLHLLRRTAHPRLCLEKCSAAILELDGKVRQSYAESIWENATALAEIILVDACFIIELFIRWFTLDVPDDIVLNNVWVVPALRQDLLLIENQIPYFVLDTLYDIIMPSLPSRFAVTPQLPNLAFVFLSPECGFEQEVTQDKFTHLLDLLRKFYLPKASSESKSTLHKERKKIKLAKRFAISRGKQVRGFKHCATRLLEAGIEFEMASEQVLTDITFSNGIIKIPTIHIDKTTYSIFRNLIVYEQCGLNISQQFTSYVGVLRSLISSSPDVRLLKKRRIITHELEDEEVVALFSSILQEVAIQNFSHDRLRYDVNTYHISWWNSRRVKAILNRDYFPNTWRTTQFVFVIVIQLLVIFQTLYAVLTYHK